MNLQNGYKVIYEKAAEGKRTFYATKNVVCDPTVDDKIIEATIGEYKLIYEKAGQFYGSTTGIPTADDHCFTEFNKVFCAHVDETEDNKCDKCEEEMPAQTTTPAVEEPVAGETPATETATEE